MIAEEKKASMLLELELLLLIPSGKCIYSTILHPGDEARAAVG